MVNKILFVDDEVHILSTLKREFEHSEYMCYFAGSGKEALEILENEEIDVLVTDMRMPKMNGLELLKIVKKDYPKVVRMVLSGYTFSPQIMAAVNQGYIFKYISKPWNYEKDLKPAIDDAVEFKRYMQRIYNKCEYKVPVEELNYRTEKCMEINNAMKEILRSLSDGELNPDLKVKVLNIISTCQDFYLRYMYNLKRERDEFILIGLLDSLRNYMKEMGFKCSIRLSGPMDYLECTYRGCEKLIYFVIKTFLEALSSYSTGKDMIIDIEIEGAGDIIKLSIFTSIDKRKDIRDIINKVSIRDDISYIYQVFNKLSKILNGSVVISEIQNQVYGKLDIPLKVLNRNLKKSC